MLMLSGCGKDKQNTNDNTNAVTPTVQPTVTLPAEDNAENQDDESADTFELQDYYPMQSDTEYVYEGTGNEFASFIRVTDFLDEEKGRIQTRTNNGGTETVRVIEVKDGKLTVVNIINECYYRDNIMEKQAEEKEEVLLMEPLVQGTEWMLSDGRKRYISAVDVEVDTPSGNYKALEVTTKSEDSTMKDYYAPQIGLIKSIFESGDMEVVSSLSKINKDTAFTQSLEVFYPNVDEKIYLEPLTLTFRTNDETKNVLQDAIRQKVSKDSYLPLASVNTKLNSLTLTEDNIVRIDFSSELVSEMNAGAGYEALILQAITNTVGNYYGVPEVLITVEGKPYESGHILMNEGETFQVSLDNVVR